MRTLQQSEMKLRVVSAGRHSGHEANEGFPSQQEMLLKSCNLFHEPGVSFLIAFHEFSMIHGLQEWLRGNNTQIRLHRFHLYTSLL